MATPTLGTSIIAGEATAPVGPVFRTIAPSTGQPTAVTYRAATGDDVERAARAAWAAFHDSTLAKPVARAALLDSAAERLIALGDTLIDLASEETGLPGPRIISERDRTVFTLRLFASMVREGSWVEAIIDHGDATRRPIPKPDVRRILKPLGPVAVFGAGNFPLAYSTAGGDTASALAAGCPVVVKGHPSHPGTGELVAQALSDAVKATGLPGGVVSFLHAGGAREAAVGAELVKHPCIRAVGFTGSVGGGTAIAALAGQRSDPIPVFAEMGSTNPVFVLPAAAEQQGQAIAERLFGSITNSVGQMCTCPGLVFAVRGDGAETLFRALADAMNTFDPQPMLSPRMHANFARRVAETAATPGVDLRAGLADPAAMKSGLKAYATLFRTGFESFRRQRTLHEETFGPAAVFVVCDDAGQLIEAAAMVQGSLTGSIFAAAADADTAASLRDVLAHRVGRLIFNGVPTGVEVCAAMVHSGPFPACNRPDHSAVGPTAARRWCRPVAFQNCPDALLPPELREANPSGIERVVDGARCR